MRSRVAATCLALGGLTYSSWVLALALPTGLSQRVAFASELEAAGHPWAWVFHLADIVSGLLIGIGATFGLAGYGLVAGGVWDGSMRRLWLGRAVFVGTAVVGFGTAISGSLPVDCSSSNGQCARLRASGATMSWHDRGHHIVSNLSGLGYTVALIALVLLVVSGGGGPAARLLVAPLVGLSLLTSIRVSSLIWAESSRGIPQRIEEAAESLFLLVLAWDVWVARRPAVHPPPAEVPARG